MKNKKKNQTFKTNVITCKRREKWRLTIGRSHLLEKGEQRRSGEQEDISKVTKGHPSDQQTGLDEGGSAPLKSQ